MATNFVKELEQLTNPAPLANDEDRDDEDTIARVIDKDALLEADLPIGSNSQRSRLRRGVLLAEQDKRYTGTVITRSMLRDEYDSDEQIDNEVGDENSDDDEDVQQSESEDDEDDVDHVDEENDKEMSDIDNGEADDNDSSGLMKIFSGVEVQDDNAKAKAVQAQIKLWEQLLGARIRYQRVLALTNQLPQTEDNWRQIWDKVSTSYDPSNVTNARDERKLYDECCRLLQSSLDGFISLQDELLRRGGVNAENKASGSDEEIVSSPDEDAEDKKADMPQRKTKKRRFKEIQDYSNFLAERSAMLKPFRDQTILKWFEKTRLASGRFARSSFGGFETNALQQIEQILADRERLIKRTQLKRSKYTVFGKHPSRTVDGQADETADVEYDDEIFDEDDFYQQLLRELIEKRTVGITDPVALSRQWLELQRLRSKSKKKQVDRRASKGRKCRYDVVPKLVNFMAPIDRCPMTDVARDELFSSLFKATS